MFLRVRCLSSCDLNLSTEQEDTYLGNLLNILMERHLKLLYDSVPSQPMFTCLHVKLHKISLYVLSMYT